MYLYHEIIGNIYKMLNWQRDISAQVSMIFAICFIALVSLAGAAITLSMDSRAANELQYTADSSALGGATAFVTSGKLKLDDRLKLSTTQAESLANRNSDFVLTDLKTIGSSEDAYGQHLRLRVELEFKPANPMAGIINRNANVDIRRKAIAEATRGFPLCVLMLAKDGRGLYMKSTATLRAEDCILWSNSTDAGSLNFSRGEATAKAFCAAGEYRESMGTVSPKPETKCRKLPNPLKGYEIPNTGPCDHHKKQFKTSKTYHLKPGVYCEGLHIRGKRVTLEPGIYVVRDGKLGIDVKERVIANGVTFLLEGTNSGVDIRGKGIELKAPSTGLTAGMAIAQNGDLTVLHKDAHISGAFDLTGVIYLPQHDLSLRQQGGGSQKSHYIQMVVNRLVLRETSVLDIEFDPTKTDLPVLIKPERSARLVE